MSKTETATADGVAELKAMMTASEERHAAEMAEIRQELREARNVSALLDRDLENSAERRIRQVKEEKAKFDATLAAIDRDTLQPWRDLVAGQHGFFIGIVAPKRQSGNIVGEETLPSTGRCVVSDSPSPHDARAKYELHLCGHESPELIDGCKVVVYALAPVETRALKEKYGEMIDSGCEYGSLNQAMHRDFVAYRAAQKALEPAAATN